MRTRNPAGEAGSVSPLLLRLGALAVVLAVWGGFLLAGNRTAPDAIDEQAAAIIDSSEPEWQVENLYLTTAERNIDPRSTLYNSSTWDTAAVHVLAIGDSYTYGFGSPDRAAAWPAQLETEIRAAGSDVRVTAMAQPGASLFTYHDWLTRLERCRTEKVCDAETVRLLDVDLVVIGFYANDLHPTPGDSILAATGQQAPPPSREQRSPFEEYAPETARRIVQDAGVPVYWMPLAGIGSNASSSGADVNWAPDRWWGLFAESGMLRIGNEETLATLERHSAAELMVNPADYHPSGILHRAYALDAAAALRGPVQQIAGQAADAIGSGTGPVVHDAVPAVTLGTGADTTKVTYRPNPGWVCDGYEPGAGAPTRARAVLSWTGLPVTGLACDDRGRAVVSLDAGRTVALPYQLCAALGRPHVELFLNPDLGKGSGVTVEGDQGFLVRPVTYDASGKRVLGEPRDLAEGFRFEAGGVRSLVVHGTGTAGCGEDREDLPGFELRITG